jgi:hypothetical protein
MPVSRSSEDRARTALVAHVERGFVEIVDAPGLCLANQRVIEIRPVPVRIADVVERTRRDQQLAIVLLVVDERLTGLMEEEREAAFQAAGDIWMSALPRSPFGK